MTLDPDNTAEISATALSRIDEVCLRFESAWRTGKAPKIEDFLDGFDEQLRSPLISELLLLDIDYRQQNGESPVAPEYHSRLPHDGSTIDSVFIHQSAQKNPDDTPRPRLCATPVDSARPQDLPQHLGRYRIIRKLGAGGFGTVYLARDDELQRNVAIKFPHLYQQAVHIDADRFLEEARIVATLSHPAIVPIFDVGHLVEDHRVCFVVSQFMDGGDLGEYLSRTRPAKADTVKIVIRLAEALHYAHGRGLVHRDVKSSNILRDENGDVYVSDFGLAIRDSTPENVVGFAGTPAYMSPEQARGEGSLVDGRTDIYALGVIFYELLVGARPFKSSSVAQLLELVQQVEPKPLRQIDNSIPGELERICLKALAKRPADRYATGDEMASELRAWQGESVSGESQKHATFILRRPMVAGLVAVLLLTAIFLVFFRLESGTPPATIESLAVLPFRPLNLDEADEYLGLAIADAVITKLGNIHQLKVRPTGSIRHYTDMNTDPVLSGRELGVDAVLEGSIQRVDESTRATIRLLRVSDGKVLWAGAFTESSNGLFAVQDHIAENVTRVLAVELSKDEQTRFDRRPTESRAAQEAYLKGRYYWNQRGSGAGVDKAITFYKQAIDEDPLFAQAYAGLAESYVLMNLYNYYQTEDAFPMGKAAAEQALKLDGGLTEAVTTLAYVKFYYEYDWDGAEKGFLRAIDLNPNYATAHQWYGEYLYFMGRFDEAVLEIDRAGELDPLSSIIRSIRGSPWLFGGDYDRAREEFLKALELHPKSGVALYGLATCYEQQSMIDDALRVYDQMHSPPNAISPSGQAGLAYVHAISGDEAEARSILQKLIPSKGTQHFSPYLIATIHAGLGETDEALVWLQTAFDEHDDRITWIKVDPKLDNLRSDIRFVEFLVEIGLAN